MNYQYIIKNVNEYFILTMHCINLLKIWDPNEVMLLLCPSKNNVTPIEAYIMQEK